MRNLAVKGGNKYFVTMRYSIYLLSVKIFSKKFFSIKVLMKIIEQV